MRQIRQSLGIVTVAAAFLAAASSDLRAEPRQQGVELRLLSVLAPNFAADYERWLGERFSVQGGMGLRSSAKGDYSGIATTASVGARYFLRKGGPSWMRAPYGGLFAEAALDLQRTAVHDEIDDESLPSTYTISVGPGFGYRVVIKQRATFTATVSVPFRVDIPTGPARAHSRANVRLGLRAGVLF